MRAGQEIVVGVAISPWSVALAHEEVNFENDSDVIRPSEVPKLEASLGEINKILGKIQGKQPSLFIKGHTDTMGSAEHNLDPYLIAALMLARRLLLRGDVVKASTASMTVPCSVP